MVAYLHIARVVVAFVSTFFPDMDIMRMMVAVCAIVMKAGAATAAGAACALSCPAIVGQQPDLPAGHAKALAEICTSVNQLLDQQPAVMEQGPVQLELTKVTRFGMTLRLTQQRGGQTVAGQPISLTTFDSDRFAPSAVRQMADLLVRHGPFSNPSSD